MPPRSEAHRKKISENMKMLWVSLRERPGFLEKLSTSHVGKTSGPHSVETKLKIGLANKFTRKLSGANHPLWKGGRTSANAKIRNSTAYKEWRRHVFQRDDYTCQACGKRGGRLVADHELPFAYFPDLRLEILNGRALCEDCHKSTPTYLVGATLIYGKAS